jgi:Fur family ferric uptake transcriptional regulator
MTEHRQQTELIERLRARPGFRMTSQRRAVAEVLGGAHVHLSAEDVHSRARAALPEISLATVYNTLHELVALGEIQELAFDGRTRRYDPNVGAPHHHLVCDDCGAIFDVSPAAPVPELPPAEQRGFQVREAEVTYRGRCAPCRQGDAIKDR